MFFVNLCISPATEYLLEDKGSSEYEIHKTNIFLMVISNLLGFLLSSEMVFLLKDLLFPGVSCHLLPDRQAGTPGLRKQFSMI
jgi:hypothetical protein